MEEKLREFVNLILYVQQTPLSEQDFLEIINQIYQNPDVLQFSLMLIESNDEYVKQFLIFIPNIISNAIKFAKSQFFDQNQLFFESITNMFMEGYEVQIMCDLWITFENYFHSPEALSFVFQSLVVLADQNTKTDFSDISSVQQFVLLYHSLVECRIRWPIRMEFPIPLEDFTTSFFPNYFVEQYFENEILIEPTFLFLKDVFQLIQISFPYFMTTPTVIESIFSFINFISTFGNERPALTNLSATHHFIKITEEIRDFIYIIPKISIQYPESTLFLSQFQLPVLEHSLNCALRTAHSFPSDLYMTISINILSIICFLLDYDQSIKDSLYEKYFDILLQISYLYSELSMETKKQLSINPLIYYENAYLKNDSRFFSFKIIEHLIELDADKTIHFIVNSEPSQGLQFLVGSICESISSLKSNPIYLQAFSEKAQQIIEYSTCNEDTFYFMTQIIFLLPLEQLEQLTILSKQFLTEFGQAGKDENITPRHQFLFTLACRAIHLLLSIQYTNQDIEQQIIFIIQHCEYCFTADGINILYGYCKLSDENFTTFGPQLFDLLIAMINQNMENSDDESFLGNRIVNISFQVIKHSFSVQNVIVPFDKMEMFISTIYGQGNYIEMDKMMVDIFKSASDNKYQYYPQLLTLYFNIHQEFSVEDIDFPYFIPFFLFIENFTDDFLKWDGLNEFVSFVISGFQESFTNSTSLIDESDVENAYYFSNALCMLILIPGLLSDQNLQSIIGLVVPHLAENQDLITFYIIFDIVTSIIYRLKANVIPDIIPKFIEFILSGCVVRTSEKIRYSKALNIVLTQTTDEEMKQYIMNCLELLSVEVESNSNEEEDIDWFFEQENIGLNAIPIPFGFQE